MIFDDLNHHDGDELHKSLDIAFQLEQISPFLGKGQGISPTFAYNNQSTKKLCLSITFAYVFESEALKTKNVAKNKPQNH